MLQRLVDDNVGISLAAVDLSDVYKRQLYNQALLIEGLPIEDPVAFSNSICELMQE